MFWKAISKLFGLVLLTVVLGVMALGGYFWYKSGQPMQVEEAQRMVPGITFREYWQSRMEQWEYWDGELRNAGGNGACVNTGKIMFAYRLVTAAPFVADLRAHRQDTNYTEKKIRANNGAVPPAELLYDNNFFDAWWATIEKLNWWAFSHDPGFPVKALGQRRACSTTYPTSAKSGE
jgi:hypothetical protein